MRRRKFLGALGAAAITWPHIGHAQQPAMLRVGTVSTQTRAAPIYVAFEQRMAELGYREGANFSLEYIQVDSIEGFKRGYDELVTRKVDILLAIGPEIALSSALAATAADPRPIVMLAIDYDPITLGYAKSLSRPGGNVSGVYFQQIDLTAKRLQLLKDTFPDRPSVTVFWDRISADQWRAAQNTAGTLGLRLAGVELREQPYDYERAFAQAPAESRRLIFAMASPFFFRDRAELAALALRHQAASMFVFREWADAGGLLSYGASITDMYRRAAEYVDRIARGAKPAELPVEQPTKFELVVNLKTAKAIGVDLPTSILLRADEVIE